MKLKSLEEENRKLKQLVGEKDLDIQALKTIKAARQALTLQDENRARAARI